MNRKLYQLEKRFKVLLFYFILTLTFGVCVGLGYLYYTTNYSPAKAVERYNGSSVTDEELDIPEYYAKPISELLITTHNHVIAFSFIFFFVGGIFYFNSLIEGKWKMFLIIEPFVSTIISFSSLWAMRFLHQNFVYVTAVSSTLIYLSFFIMVSLIIYELKFKENVIG